jgi:hypothetical protein
MDFDFILGIIKSESFIDIINNEIGSLGNILAIFAAGLNKCINTFESFI